MGFQEARLGRSRPVNFTFTRREAVALRRTYFFTIETTQKHEHYQPT